MPLVEAVREACVERGLEPGTELCREKVRAEMLDRGVPADEFPCAQTIDKCCRRPEIITARITTIQGDHATRIMKMRKECVSAHRVVVFDVTSFTGDERDKRRVLYVVDDGGNILGVGNACFGLHGGSRDIWTVLPFVRAANATLIGFALHQGCLSKDSIYRELGLTPQKTPCGKPALFFHDLGSENENAHIKRVFSEMNVLFNNTGPGGLPEFRGELERFHRTAHRMFDLFLESEEGRLYFVAIPNMPGAKGIRMRDFRLAMWRWVLVKYRHSENKGIGNATPAERFEDFVLGRKGFPVSGYLGGMADTDEFRWRFLRERFRVITHLGIEIDCRRYSHPRLAEFFVPGKRTSVKRIAFRYNQFALGKVVIRLPNDELLDVPYVYDRDKLPVDAVTRNKITNCSEWEWKEAYRALRRVGKKTPTPDEANGVVGLRIAESQGGQKKGAPSAATKRADHARRSLAETFGPFASDISPSPQTDEVNADEASDDGTTVDGIDASRLLQMLPCAEYVED
jgi:hypothetical protein